MLKHLLASLSLIAVAGFGCRSFPLSPSTAPAETEQSTGYQNSQYGFGFDYPKSMDVHNRTDETRATDYLGMNVDFFVSLRDIVMDTKPTTIAYFYAVTPAITADGFKISLEATNPNGAVKVTNVEDVTVNGIAMKKVTSTTEMKQDKTHYLFDTNGSTIIVSVFLNQESAFEGVLPSFQFE